MSDDKKSPRQHSADKKSRNVQHVHHRGHQRDLAEGKPGHHYDTSIQPTLTPRDFKVVATSLQDEDAFNYAMHRPGHKSGSIGAVANMVKGALGGGIMSAHVAYMKAGFLSGMVLNISFGIYMAYCLHILVKSAQRLYGRTRVPSMSYPDVGEAALACCPSPRLRKFSKCFRYSIDVIICIDLFGSCACYQLIIGKTIKQLVENVQETSIHGKDGNPDLRVYMACMIIPIILICFITELKWLAPFSILANFFVLCAIMTSMYFAHENNPNFSNMVPFTNLYNQFEYVGMAVFSMSCAGVVIPIENSMTKPHQFPYVLLAGMTGIISCIFMASFFGYVGYLDKCESPVTMNFPMTTGPKILKATMAVMVYITHAVNFWVPFNLCFYYIKKRHNQEKIFRWELFYRAIFVLLIATIAIAFPDIDALMGFLGTFCLSNMAFIWPNLIETLVLWERPGLGKYYWRLWKSITLICIGIFILICGSIVNTIELMTVFTKSFS